MKSSEDAPLRVGDTHGILLRPEHKRLASSDSLDWRSLYVSRQLEQPYSDHFVGRDDHLIIVHLSGPVRVERDLSGERSRSRITTGGLFILPPKRDFGVSLLAPLETVHLYVRSKLVTAAATELCKGDPDALEFIPRLGEHDGLIEQLGRMACGLLEEGQTDFFADGIARLLAAQLVRHHSSGLRKDLPRITGLQPHQLAAVRGLIEERMEETLSIEDLAGAAGLSPIHFARQFKRTTGISPHQFLMEARVVRARDLLASRLSIAEIAYRCGFSHQEHMTRLFGRQLGVTPAAYRKSLAN